MIENAPIKETVEELRKLIHISNYVGEPIESEDKILQKAEQAIAATGAGVSVEPVTMVVVSKGNKGVEGIRTINLTKGNETNKTLNEVGLILTDILKDILPSKKKDDEYINVKDVTEVEIKDGEIKEKVEDAIDEVEEELDIEIDDE